MRTQHLTVHFHSRALDMDTQINLLIPQEAWTSQGGVASAKEYPTVYLLHGSQGDFSSWQRYSSIERYVADNPVIVVMPSAEQSWYTDTRYGYGFLTYITKELPFFLKEHFCPVSTSPETTFVAGLSMGGYGALKVGLTAPELFGRVVALSSAFDVSGRAKGALSERKAFWEGIFGEADSIENSDHDVYYLAQKIKEEGKPLPKIYLWCGTEDWRIVESRKMRDHLTALGYAVSYSESEGDHSWRYWDEQIALHLPKLLQKESEQ